MKMAGLNLLKSSGAEPPFFLDLLVRNWNFSGKNSPTLPDFLKLPGKVIELFKNCSPGLPVFLKKVWQCDRYFRKKAGNVVGLFRKVHCRDAGS
jgi:hypothetical protein